MRSKKDDNNKLKKVDNNIRKMIVI